MKIHFMLSVAALLFVGTPSHGQDLEAEVPGDNFSLEGALDLFKKSESPEHFERLLNSPESKVNNLDLNGDGFIDYIRVFDRSKDNIHVFVLQAVISEYESQDVAVIELEKLPNGEARLQIIGDPDIYGEEVIIEPTTAVRTYAGTQTTYSVDDVWAWPSVQYVYSPYYTNWWSPWGWDLYPVWYHTWAPVAYVYYSPIYVTYRPYYSFCETRRIVHAHRLYHPYRTTSVVVYERHHDRVAYYRSHHRNSYPRDYTNDGHRMNTSGRDSYDRNNRRNQSSHSSRSDRGSRGSRGSTDSENTNEDRATSSEFIKRDRTKFPQRSQQASDAPRRSFTTETKTSEDNSDGRESSSFSQTQTAPTGTQYQRDQQPSSSEEPRRRFTTETRTSDNNSDNNSSGREHQRSSQTQTSSQPERTRDYTPQSPPRSREAQHESGGSERRTFERQESQNHSSTHSTPSRSSDNNNSSHHESGRSSGESRSFGGNSGGNSSGGHSSGASHSSGSSSGGNSGGHSPGGGGSGGHHPSRSR